MILTCFLSKNTLGQACLVFKLDIPQHAPQTSKPKLAETQQDAVEGLIGEAEWKVYRATADKCVQNGLMSQAAVNRWKANPSFFSKEKLVNAIHWDTFATKYVDAIGRVNINRVDKELGPFFIGLIKKVKTTQEVPSYEEPRLETFFRFKSIHGYTFDRTNQEFLDSVHRYAEKNGLDFLSAEEQMVKGGYVKR